MKGKVLVVDDDRSMTDLLSERLKRRQFEVTAAQSVAAARVAFDAAEPDVVVTDLNMPGQSGIEFCEWVVTNRADTPVILITAFGSLDTAIAAIRAGAYDFITKPFEIDVLAIALERAIKHRELRHEVTRLRSLLDTARGMRELLGESPVMRELKELLGRVADSQASVLVTGGSRGIGKAIALRFAEQGAARVSIGYLRNDRAAEDTASELQAAGAEPLLLRGSVASERVAAEAAELGPFDVLVHNAATGVIRPALETEDKHWDWTLSANARALLTLARACVPQMPEGSSIVGVSSLGSIRVMDNYTLVGVSKAALESLVRYLAVELAPRKIRVNAVSAGVVETGALEHFPNREEMLASGTGNPAGKLVTPEDIAGVVSFLCSADAEMIRGQTLVIDGGWSLPAG